MKETKTTPGIRPKKIINQRNHIGQVIKDLRKQKKLQQIEFCKKCKITQTYLSQIENGVKEPTIAVLKNIANGLGIPLPIVFLMSLDKNDIDKKKQKSFDTVFPSVYSMLKEFFK